MNNYRTFLLAITAAISLSACATLETVGDAVGSINPFDKSGSETKEVDPNRISILELDDQLKVTGTVAPTDIVLPNPVPPNDWAQIGGNAVHSFPRLATEDGSLEKAWTTGFGKGSSRKGRVLAQPVIQGDWLFIMDADNTVRAIDGRNGNKLWDYKIKSVAKGPTRQAKVKITERVTDPLSVFDKGGKDKHSVGGGVAIDGTTVYATSGLGIVTALNAETGAPIWEKDLRVPLHSGPTYSDGRLFTISDDNELFALDTQTGEVIWTYQAIVESARMLTMPAAAVIDDVVIAPFSSGELVALRVQNGGVLWQDSLSGSGLLTPLASLNDIAAGPVVSDGYVVASAQSGQLNAFDLRTGQRVWSVPAGTLSFPWVAGDYVYAATTNGEIICVSKIDGSVIWLTQLDSYKNPKKRKSKIVWTGPILIDDNLVVVSSRGDGLELDPFDGSIKAEFNVPKGVFVPPAFAGGTLYLVSDNAKLSAYK